MKHVLRTVSLRKLECMRSDLCFKCESIATLSKRRIAISLLPPPGLLSLVTLRRMLKRQLSVDVDSTQRDTDRNVQHLK